MRFLRGGGGGGGGGGKTSRRLLLQTLVVVAWLFVKALKDKVEEAVSEIQETTTGANGACQGEASAVAAGPAMGCMH